VIPLPVSVLSLSLVTVTVASDQVRPSSDSARVTVVVVPVVSLVDVESPVILLPLLVPLWVPEEVSVSASVPSVASLTLRVCDDEKVAELVETFLQLLLDDYVFWEQLA
jgi:hypothetical protein